MWTSQAKLGGVLISKSANNVTLSNLQSPLVLTVIIRLYKGLSNNERVNVASISYLRLVESSLGSDVCAWSSYPLVNTARGKYGGLGVPALEVFFLLLC